MQILYAIFILLFFFSFTYMETVCEAEANEDLSEANHSQDKVCEDLCKTLLGDRLNVDDINTLTPKGALSANLIEICANIIIIHHTTSNDEPSYCFDFNFVSYLLADIAADDMQFKKSVDSLDGFNIFECNKWFIFHPDNTEGWSLTCCVNMGNTETGYVLIINDEVKSGFSEPFKRFLEYIYHLSKQERRSFEEVDNIVDCKNMLPVSSVHYLFVYYLLMVMDQLANDACSCESIKSDVQNAIQSFGSDISIESIYQNQICIALKCKIENTISIHSGLTLDLMDQIDAMDEHVPLTCRSMSQLLKENERKLIGHELVLQSFDSTEISLYDAAYGVKFRNVCDPNGLYNFYAAILLKDLTSFVENPEELRTSLYEYLELLLKGIKIKLDTVMANNLLTEHSAQMYLSKTCNDEKLQQFNMLDLKTQISQSQMSVKSFCDKVRLEYRKRFKGAKLKGNKSTTQKYLEYMLFKDAIRSLAEQYKGDHFVKFLEFVASHDIDYIADQPESLSQPSGPKIDTVLLSQTTGACDGGGALEDIITVDAEVAPLLEEEVNAPVEDPANFYFENFLSNSTTVSDDGVKNKNLIRLYYADSNQLFENCLRGLKDELKSELVLTDELQQLGCTEAILDIIRKRKRDVEDSAYNNVLLKLQAKLGSNCSENVASFHRRFFTTVGTTRFYQVICRNLIFPLNESNKVKLTMEKLFRAVCRAHQVPEPESSEMDSLSGEFVKLYSFKDNMSLQKNAIIFMNILDKLQYLTMRGYENITSLQPFSKATIDSVLPNHLPVDFLTACSVNDDVIQLIHAQELELFTAQHCDIRLTFTKESTLYYTDESILSLVSHIRSHILQITALRPAVHILVIGCEQPLLIIEIYVHLCRELQDRVNDLLFTVVDRDKNVCNRGDSIVQQRFQFIAGKIKFIESNFLEFNNNNMANFDIALTFNTSVSNAFALKFILLAFTVNARPYFKCSKLFLAPRLLFDKARNSVAAKVHNLQTRERVIVAFTNGFKHESKRDLFSLYSCVDVNDEEKHIVYKFRYHRCDDECELVFKNTKIRNVFADELVAVVDKAKRKTFKGFCSPHYNLFGDILPSSQIQIEGRLHDSIAIYMHDCDLIVPFSKVNGLQQTPQMTEDESFSMESTNSTGFVLQTSFIINDGSAEGLAYVKNYLNVNINNAMHCCASIEYATEDYMTKVCEATECNYDLSFNLIDDCAELVSSAYSQQIKNRRGRYGDTCSLEKLKSYDLDVNKADKWILFAMTCNNNSSRRTKPNSNAVALLPSSKTKRSVLCKSDPLPKQDQQQDDNNAALLYASLFAAVVDSQTE